MIDTAGLEDATDDSLQGRMRRLTERAVDMADICLFMIDARVGVTPVDEILQKSCANGQNTCFWPRIRAEGAAADAGVLEAWNLGLGEPLRISAEHGEGMGDLLAALMPIADEFQMRAEAEAAEAEIDIIGEISEDDEYEYQMPTNAKPLQVAVVGRPNAGNPR